MRLRRGVGVVTRHGETGEECLVLGAFAQERAVADVLHQPVYGCVVIGVERLQLEHLEHESVSLSYALRVILGDLADPLQNLGKHP